MREIARFVNKLRGLNHVERWNFTPHLRRENVAEHSLWVATFTAILAPAESRAALVLAAISHDFEESITADLPALVKAHTPEWHAVVTIAEGELFGAAVGIEEREIQDAFVGARKLSEESSVVKIADLFAALMYARMEIELGNTHFFRIEREMIKSICDKASRETTDAGVGRRAMSLLVELGFDKTQGLDRPLHISHL